MKALPDPLLRLARTFSFVRGNILVLTISGSLGMFSRNMVFPYVPLYILSLGGSPGEVGIVYALGPLGGLLMFPIAGYLADRMNRAILIAAAGYFSAAMLLINVVAPTWEWVAAARLLQGLAVFHFPASSAIIADSLPPGHRGRGMATTAALAGSLALFAPYVAGATLDRWGIDSGKRMLYVAMAVAYAVGATINLFFIRETRPSPVESFNFAYLSRALRQAYSGIWPMLRGFPSALRALSTVIILCFISNAVAGPFWVVYVTTHIGLSSSEWGLILLAETGLRNLATVPAGFLTDHYGRCRFIIASLAASLVIPLFVWTGSFAQVLLIRCIIGLASAFLSPAMGALMADTVPSATRGRVMAAIGRGSVMIGGASGGIGGPGTGYLITGPLAAASLAGGALYAWNPVSPFLAVFGLTLLALIVAFRSMRDPHDAET
ncbi:MAG: MFS transporter [Verrucomicrobia bacterium]|nr:MFS transporter [Verrucomicrobiota bacterium]